MSISHIIYTFGAGVSKPADPNQPDPVPSDADFIKGCEFIYDGVRGISLNFDKVLTPRTYVRVNQKVIMEYKNFAQMQASNDFTPLTSRNIDIRGVIKIETTPATQMKIIGAGKLMRINKVSTEITNFRVMGQATQFLNTIDQNAFKGCTKITSLANAFENCINLRNLPPELFRDCKNLTHINHLFKGCTSLGIVDNLFKNCNNIIYCRGLYQNARITHANNPLPNMPYFYEVFKDTIFDMGGRPLVLNLGGHVVIDNMFEGSNIDKIPQAFQNIFIDSATRAFYNCKHIMEIPPRYFTSAKSLVETFAECRALRTIGKDCFSLILGGNYTDDAGNTFRKGTFLRTFENCVNLKNTIKSLLNTNKELWQLCPSHPEKTYKGCISLPNYNQIPTNYK